LSNLEIRLLGPPDIRVGGGPLAVDTRKAVALLAYLAVERTAHRREALAEMLWPEYERESARGALRRTLSNLRKALDGRFLVVKRDAIELDDSDVYLDAVEFRRLIDRADRHEHSRDQPCLLCERNLTEAVGLHRGDFMRGFSLRDSIDFEEWQLYQSDAFRRRLATALDRLSLELDAAGREDAAIESAQRRLTLDPLHEPAHRLLMSLYAARGRRSEAVRQYRQCVAVLERELGVPPLAETTELYQAIKEERVPVRPRSGEISPRVATVRERQAPPMVGRELELRTLAAAYEQLGDDRRFAVIEGEAGIGKSRLAEDFLARVTAAGGVTLIARCYEEERNLAFAPVVATLRLAFTREGGLAERIPRPQLGEVARLLPDLVNVVPAEASTDPGAQSRFLSAISRALIEACAGPKPGVLFFDDLQWADTASLEVLGWLLRREGGAGLFVLGAYRDEDANTAQVLRKRVPPTSSIHLSRLSETEVIELVSASTLDARIVPPTTLAARLFRETEGLPLFVIEYLASLEANQLDTLDWEWPEEVRQLLRSRVLDASEIARQILAAAAVVGRSFDFDTVRASSGRGDEESVLAVEELVRRGLINEVDDELGSPTYDFSHEKIRTLVYEETGLARRRLLHGRTADVLIRSASTSSSDERLWLPIANHCRLGGREEDAANYYVLAGKHSRRVFANKEAMAHFKSALALGHLDPALVHEAIGDLHTLMGEYGAAVTSYETAAALHGSESVPAIEHKLGRVHHRRGDWESATSHYKSVLEQPATSGDAAFVSRVLADWSLTLHHAGDSAGAQELAARSLQLAESSGEEGARAQATNMLGILAAGRGDFDSALEHLAQSRALAEETGDHAAQVAALNNMALAYRAVGELDRALDLTAVSLLLCEVQGDRHREAALHNNLADLLQALGRSEEAMGHLKRAVAIFAEVGEPGEMEPAIWKLVEW
jgi:DNA-binding SARP family transcriptional activator